MIRHCVCLTAYRYSATEQPHDDFGIWCTRIGLFMRRDSDIRSTYVRLVEDSMKICLYPFNKLYRRSLLWMLHIPVKSDNMLGWRIPVDSAESKWWVNPLSTSYRRWTLVALLSCLWQDLTRTLLVEKFLSMSQISLCSHPADQLGCTCLSLNKNCMLHFMSLLMFRITNKKMALDLLMAAEFWPTGILRRRFFKWIGYIA